MMHHDACYDHIDHMQGTRSRERKTFYQWSERQPGMIVCTHKGIYNDQDMSKLTNSDAVIFIMYMLLGEAWLGN